MSSHSPRKHGAGAAAASCPVASPATPERKRKHVDAVPPAAAADTSTPVLPSPPRHSMVTPKKQRVSGTLTHSSPAPCTPPPRRTPSVRTPTGTPLDSLPDVSVPVSIHPSRLTPRKDALDELEEMLAPDSPTPRDSSNRPCPLSEQARRHISRNPPASVDNSPSLRHSSSPASARLSSGGANSLAAIAARMAEKAAAVAAAGLPPEPTGRAADGSEPAELLHPPASAADVSPSSDDPSLSSSSTAASSSAAAAASSSCSSSSMSARPLSITPPARRVKLFGSPSAVRSNGRHTAGTADALTDANHSASNGHSGLGSHKPAAVASASATSASSPPSQRHRAAPLRSSPRRKSSSKQLF